MNLYGLAYRLYYETRVIVNKILFPFIGATNVEESPWGIFGKDKTQNIC